MPNRVPPPSVPSFLSRLRVVQANGTYELAGFRHGAPVYTKGKDDVSVFTLSLELSLSAM